MRPSRLFQPIASAPAAALVFLIALPSMQGAERIRVYEFGENDPGAILGGMVIETQDSQGMTMAGPDGAGEFVPLIAEFFGEEPILVEGRNGPGSLAIDFDGVDDRLISPAFDPRHFGGSFTALSQAWLKPDSARQGNAQFIWSLGNDNGGVGITANGFWQIIASSSVPDTPSTVPVAFDDWTHVAVRRTGNDAFLFVNGQLVVSGANFWNGVGLVTVGNRTSENPLLSINFYDGVIDDFVISGLGAFNAAEDLDFFEDLVLSGVQGDVDQDGDADQEDYDIWSRNVGFNNMLGNGDPSTLLMGDLDLNGRINFFDLNEIVQGARAQGNAIVTTGVPEPASLLLVLVGLISVSISRCRWAWKKLGCGVCVVVLLLFGVATDGAADVVVAEDFLYIQPTKALGPGGGFTLQDYGGGQNGRAGQWEGRWASIGNGIITSSDIMMPDNEFQALVAGGLSAAELNRDYSLRGLTNIQTLYFGIRMRTGAIDDTPDARFNINPSESAAQIGIGLLEGTYAAHLGDQSAVGLALANDGLFHTLVGKIEFNAVGANERLTVWLNPTGPETGPDSTVLEHDVVSGLNDLEGNLELFLSLPDPFSGPSVWWDDLAIGTTWEDAAEVEIPRLDLRINTQTGSTRLFNQTGEDMAFNYIELVSGRGSLNIRDWAGLAEQGIDGGAWQENSSTARLLVESNFSGSSVLPAGANWSLGKAFTLRRFPDIVARVGNEQGLLNLVNVEYVTGPDEIVGDYNGSGLVEQGDLDLVLLNWGQDGSTPPMGWNTDLPSGLIDQGELDKVLLNWGNSAGTALAVGAVPEPTSVGLVIAWLIGLGVCRGRRKLVPPPT